MNKKDMEDLKEFLEAKIGLTIINQMKKLNVTRLEKLVYLFELKNDNLEINVSKGYGTPSKGDLIVVATLIEQEELGDKREVFEVAKDIIKRIVLDNETALKKEIDLSKITKQVNAIMGLIPQLYPNEKSGVN